MTSSLSAVKIVLLLGLVLPVTPDSTTTSPSASSEPEDDQATEGWPQDSGTAEADIGNGLQTIAAVHNEVLNATEAPNASTVFTLLTTFLTDMEPTSTDPPKTSPPQETTRRSVTTLEDNFYARANDEARRREHNEIFLYEYGSLRQWGLICALILCIIGFLVLFSGRCRGFSCRKRQRRKYNITGV